MLTHSPKTTLHRKIIYDFVWIYLGQHCIRKLLCNVGSWLRDNSHKEYNLYNVVSTMLGQYCITIVSSRCCLNTFETTLHKKNTYAMLSQSEHIYFHRKVSNMSGSLVFNLVQYHQTIFTLFVQCWLGSSFTACGIAMNKSRFWLEYI